MTTAPSSPTSSTPSAASSSSSASDLAAAASSSSPNSTSTSKETETTTTDETETTETPTWMKPLCPTDGKSRLTIVQITDVYTLDHFPSLKTMIQQIKSTRRLHDRGSQDQQQQQGQDQVLTMLTGDFLAPYLLSSIDDGDGMMMAIKETPIDVLTWGNHEADVEHSKVCQHVANFTQGQFINSNMQSHDTMKLPNSVPYKIIELSSSGGDDGQDGEGEGRKKYKIGFVATLSNDPKLYSHFKKTPGAFGGATIDCPYTTLKKYKLLLEEEHGCDLVVPLEHMYVPENTKTCELYKDCGSIPLILSGHDHHKIDEIIYKTRLIKPGQDAVTAAVIEIIFDHNDNDDAGDGNGRSKPLIRSSFVETSQFEPCPILKEKCEQAYDVLQPLRKTMLAGVLPQFFPLTSKNARGSVTTMGKLICSMLKEALRQSYYYSSSSTASSSSSASSNDDDDSNSNNNSSLDSTMMMKVDAVILMGGNIRGNEDYPDGSFFSLQTLEAEIKHDEVVGFVNMPGHVLAAGIEATHSGDPIPGWFQYDDGITQEENSDNKVLTVGDRPIEPNRIYRVATKIKDLTNGQSPPLKAYYTAHPELLPAKGQYVNIHSELMKFFARGMFRKLWESTAELIPPPTTADVDGNAAAVSSSLTAQASTKSGAMSSVSESETESENDDGGDDDSSPTRSRSQSMPRSRSSSLSNPLGRTESELRLAALDGDNKGFVSVDDIHDALGDFLGLPIDDGNYKPLAEHVHACADVTGTGTVDLKDFEIICEEGLPPELDLSPKWEEVFPDPLPDSSPEVFLQKQQDRDSNNVSDDGQDNNDQVEDSSDDDDVPFYPLTKRHTDATFISSITSRSSSSSLQHMPSEIVVRQVEEA